MSGDTEYTETSYFQVNRDVDVDFEKLPVDASLEMEDQVMDMMEPVSYTHLVVRTRYSVTWFVLTGACSHRCV